ncbi:MAG: ABC transporter ATP-binding protein/permease [Firmicutes bacterium]|jgi:ATP-binding cassette subfamily B protein|nr:ABC transporter ATP-binding protein/permease [Bacillota bacterium]
MVKLFKKHFGLSDEGAINLYKASIACFVTNIFIMGLVGILFLFMKETINLVMNDAVPEYNIIFYFLYSIVLLVILYICIHKQYNLTFLCSYEESANKRISLAERLRKLPLSFFGKRDLADLTTTIMTDTASLETAFSHFIPELFGAVISTIVVSISILFIDFEMGISLIWVVPVSFLLVIITKKYQDIGNIKNKEIQLDYADGIQECIENIKDIKSNNQVDKHMERIDDKLKAFEKNAVKAELVTGIFVTSAQMILKIGVTTSVITGVYRLTSGEIDLFTFIVFMMVATRIFDPLAGALINLAAVFASLLKVKRMKEVEYHPIQEGEKEKVYKKWDIEFQNVHFEYNQGEKVLNGVSFKARQGEITALVGPSGGGKSTVAKLASRFWDPSHGRIILGGNDVTAIEPEELMENYSIVFQDVVLFNNTIMENIRIGKKDATDEEVYKAAKAARCHTFIEKLEDGYKSMIGENGCILSGGERQRISIARALLKDAPVILLDEATASLDIENESLIQEAISKLIKDKTVIVIAHRMRTIAQADNIVVLKEGQVEEQGNHTELIDKNNIYSKMVQLQIESNNWVLE